MAMTYSSDIASLFASKVAGDAAYKFNGDFGITDAILGGQVTGLTVTAAGDGYTAIPAVTFTSGGGNGSGVTVEVSMKATSATTTGGTGFAANDTITLSNGVVLKVATEASGVPATYTIQSTPDFVGTIVTAPTIVSRTGSGVVTGMTVALKFGVAGLRLLTLGGGYSSAPTVVFTGTNTSPATATATVSAIAQAEKNVLTLIEVLRAYTAGISSRAEAMLVSDLLRHAAAEINGAAASDASVIADLTQKKMMRRYADPRRKSL